MWIVNGVLIAGVQCPVSGFDADAKLFLRLSSFTSSARRVDLSARVARVRACWQGENQALQNASRVKTFRKTWELTRELTRLTLRRAADRLWHG